ncbi:hypothetical protein [Pantoea septica]|uniref:hypothetical protein n=1 Tax=Pantoea septica TaxID=472695 RepID=UPI003D002EF2
MNILINVLIAENARHSTGAGKFLFRVGLCRPDFFALRPGTKSLCGNSAFGRKRYGQANVTGKSYPLR